VLGLTLVTLGMAFALARQSARGRRRRLVCGALFAASFGASATGVVWLFGVAMPRALPIMIVAQRVWPVHVWASSILLVGVLTAACAFRLARTSNEGRDRADRKWRTRARYYHEQTGMILLLAVGVGAQAVGMVETPLSFLRYFLAELLVWRTTSLLRLALVLAAAGAVWRLVRGSRSAASECLPALAPGRFAAAWLALFLTAATLIPAICVFAFTLWFSPLWTARWL
jgi:hypothetical protein